MGQEYKRSKTTVSLLNYHFVFCPRYRRKVLVGDVEVRFKELLQEVCEEMGIEIIAVECDEAHCHLFVNSLPTLSPADIMAKVKGVTSKKLREEYDHLRHLPSLWTRSYFVSTAGNVSSETVKSTLNLKRKGGDPQWS